MSPGTTLRPDFHLRKDQAMFRTWAIALLALFLLVGQDAGAAPALTLEAINGAALTDRPGRSEAAVIKAQILLDRAGFSPGEINGRLDENARNAISAFEAEQRLPVDGKLNPALWMALNATSGDPVIMEYTISSEDLRGPFLKRLPSRMEDMKNLDHLGYTSSREALAERFHMSEGLLVALNRGKSFDRAGTQIVVADVAAAPPGKKAVRIEIDKPLHLLRAFGPQDQLLAVFPASIGSTEKPAPSGTFKVTSVIWNPTYHYDPAYAFKGVKTKRPFTIKPGPNNPVGVAWIGLSAKGYGIHGTPDSATVGKTASHGCIRLTNWDAEKLAGMVGKGVLVAFLDGSAAPPAWALAAPGEKTSAYKHERGTRRRP
jgi:lipoprotein-anchoring transpeptidase ErfK/SrfK